MMEKINLEDLVQYLYNEVSAEKRSAIDIALESNFELREKLQVMATASKRLAALSFSPRQQTIDSIMDYAAKGQEALSH
ncbi:MAG TPA: hypothetical protein PLE75_07470 [Ferruginibacter sp.]|jgi:hypothetical protein|nr:hypothetical protein [Ferruginibacter sp.]HRN91432.1 hypothetical protein [Ferruginibacter sp.]HRO06506.1 hypothetical protein [Ferruginibacter sp.]HRO95469.1 hypothetical protein [Ferruginibacter sp.]HRP49945.1 hypothetical protein [Ferruginibacter sp.]